MLIRMVKVSATRLRPLSFLCALHDLKQVEPILGQRPQTFQRWLATVVSLGNALPEYDVLQVDLVYFHISNVVGYYLIGFKFSIKFL